MTATAVSSPAQHPPTPRPDARRRRRAGRSWQGWLYAAPATAVLVVLFIVPLGLAVWMSLNDWPLLGDVRGVNFPDNYTRVPDDELFLNAVGFTLKYTAIITVVLLLLSFGLALLVQESKRRITGILRTAYFLPVVTGLTTAALLFLGLLNPTVGPIAGILAQWGLKVDWLGTPDNALLSTVLMMTWRFAGFYMIIMLSGLQAVPRELYEAAAVDGASPWRVLRSITLPLMRSTISLCMVLIVTGGLVAFEQFYVLTGGGPDNSTVTVVMTIFRQAFSQFNLGYAAALSVVVLLGLVILNIVQLRLVRDNPEGDKR
jgi:multiple sugar transport system permease protein